MLETIYIARHGFRSNWIDPSIVTSVTGTERDPPLASYGLEQAEQLADFLSSPPDSLPLPELLFTSPFYRCIQTALSTAQRLGKPLKLEHGVQEWYSPIKPNSGLHPRPHGPERLQQYFPPNTIDTGYKSTVYASRRGETLQELQGRCDLFVDAWIARTEAEHPDVKTVVIFAHAASVIALGRSLTGDRRLEVKAGCASTSLYKRRRKQDQAADSAAPTGSEVGAWEMLWDGRADYLTNGLERNWSFDQVVLNDQGHVVDDDGTGHPFDPADELPVGIGPGMERYLARSGRQDGQVKPSATQTPEKDPQVPQSRM